MVSNEDREAAWGVVVDVRGSLRHPADADSWDIINALVSHGWGPKPVIYSETILDHVSTPEAATSLIDVLLQNGIEVRE